LKNKAHPPEGTYITRQSKLQFYKYTDWLDRQKSHIWRGSWPSGVPIFGNRRHAAEHIAGQFPDIEIVHL